MTVAIARSSTSDNPVSTIVVEPHGASSVIDRVERIAMAAYYKAEARGFAPGHEMEDWLQAETEVDAQA